MIILDSINNLKCLICGSEILSDIDVLMGRRKCVNRCCEIKPYVDLYYSGIVNFLDKTIVFKKPHTHDFGNHGSFTSYVDKFYLSTDMCKMYIIHNQDQIFVIPNDFSVDDLRKYYHNYDDIVKICGVFK